MGSSSGGFGLGGGWMSGRTAAALGDVREGRSRRGVSSTVATVATADGAPDTPEGPRKPALDGVSFEIEPGMLVALVGPSGAGKTTVTYLIPRFYDPTGGRVTLDGYDLRDLKLDSLAAQFGIRSIPTLMIFKGGEVKEQMVGAMRKDDLKAKLSPHLG